MGTALRSLVRYFHLRARGAVVTLALDGDMASLRYEVYPRLPTDDPALRNLLQKQIDALEAEHGAAFTPCEYLLQKADSGRF